MISAIPLFGSTPSPLRCEPDDRALFGLFLPHYGRGRLPRDSGRFYLPFARSLRSLQNSPAQRTYRLQTVLLHAAPEARERFLVGAQ